MMYGKYMLTADYAYSYAGGPSYLSSDAARYKQIPLDVAQTYENYDIELSGLVCRSYESDVGWTIKKYYSYEDSKEHYRIADKHGKQKYLIDASYFES